MLTLVQIEQIAEAIRGGQSERAAITQAGFHHRTWAARKRENPEMDKILTAAEDDLLNHEMSMGRVIEIVDKAFDAASAQVA